MRAASLVVLVLCACVEPTPDAVELTVPVWRDGETSVYHITRNDSVLYESRVVLRFDEEMLEGTGHSTSPAAGRGAGESVATATVIVTTTVTPVEARLFFHDSSTVVMRRDSLTPLRSYRSLETNISVFDIEVRYGEREVEVNRQSIDGREARTFKRERLTFDNEQVQTLVRAVPLASGTRFRFHRVVPMDLRVVPTDLMVLGTKQVTTEFGNIICREVVLITPAKELKLWYEIAEPHRFIGMRDPGNGTEMLLVRYTTTRPDDAAPEPFGEPGDLLLDTE